MRFLAVPSGNPRRVGLQKITRCFGFVALLFLAAGFEGRATSVRAMEIDEVVRAAGQIFYGRVTTVRTGVVPGMDVPYTEYTFEVSEWVRGGSGQTVTIRQVGSGRGAAVPGLPSYKKGQEVVLCLHAPSRIGLTSPVGIQQGYYPVVRQVGGERAVQLGSMSASVGRMRAALKGSAAPAVPEEQVSLTDFLLVLRGIR